MGSRNCAELLKDKKISKKEADILFIITNNISPVFISSYILQQQLVLPELTIISYLVLYLPPLVLGALWLNHSSLHNITSLCDDMAVIIQKKPTSGSQMNFKIIDAGIMNGFETLTRLGGYIMLFSILANLVQRIPIPLPLGLLITGTTEITIGIQRLCEAPVNTATRYVLAMAFTAFGGMSGIAQTSSMIKDTGLSLKKYSITKVILTAVSTLLAIGVAVWFQL